MNLLQRMRSAIAAFASSRQRTILEIVTEQKRECDLFLLEAEDQLEHATHRVAMYEDRQARLAAVIEYESNAQKQQLAVAPRVAESIRDASFGEPLASVPENRHA